MADAKAYAEWLVANKDKQGTEEFQKVSAAYSAARNLEPPKPAQASRAFPSWDPNGEITLRYEKKIAEDYPRAMTGADKVGTDMALEGGGGAIGQAVGALPVFSGPTMGLSVPIGGFFGGAAGNLAAQARQRSNGEINSISVPQAIGAGVASMWPGAPVAGAGVKAVAKEAAKQGAMNLAGTAVQSIGENKQLPDIGQAMGAVAGGVVGTGLARGLDTGAKVTAATRKAIDNAVRDETLVAARSAGYKVAPSQLSDAPAVTRALEWLAGGPQTVAATENTARTVNIALARKAIGMPEGAVLDLDSLARIREQKGRIYGDIEAVSNKAATALKEFREARDRSRAFWLENERQGTVSSQDSAKAWDAKMDTARTKLEQELKDKGRADLIPAFNDARVTIAKVHLIEDAFEEGEGSVMADLIARRRKAGKTITTDELEVMANFSRATGLKGGKPNKVSPVAHPLVAGGAIGSAMMQGGAPMALAAGAGSVGIPMLAKSVLLSNPVQNALMAPSYRAPMPMDLRAAMAQLSAMSAGRDVGAEDIRPVPYR